MVWYGGEGGGVLTSEIDWRWTFDLCIDVKKLLGGGRTLDYSVSSSPFLNFEIEIGDGPGPEIDKSSILNYILVDLHLAG